MPARVTHQSIMMVTLSFTFAAAFNNTVCPAPWELQSPRMRTFQLDQLAGMYLELALHDVTQYPLCPSKPRCISSNKTIARHADGTRFVYDEWNLSCMGSYWPQTLLFNETNITGHLLGYVPVTQIPFLPPSVVGSVVFPDTIVDFKPGANGWAVEFQCVQKFGHVVFVGINFYARRTTEEVYAEMLAAARASGIDYYTNQNFGLHNVSQDDCPGPSQSS